ncbi:MAG TPA: hypothetical protein VFN76_03785 [Candidatus Limnocylindria bacterium]|nr:hypothetical protein [Candidatus Limnocylindria bacterium]
MTSEPSDLRRIHVRFGTFRDRSVDERSDLAKAFATVRARERVVVETCHRVELVTVDDREEREALTGRAAIRRVFEVVAGFDSAVVAEEQLLGQVRGAYEAALASGSSGPILNELFRRALRFGRKVRTHATPGTDRSLADVGAAWLLERLPASAAVLVAGTGEMGRLAATRLASAGHAITVVSGSAERGGRLLERLPGSGHRLVTERLSSTNLTGHAGGVLAVRVREPILDDAALPRGPMPWILDLSTPAAVGEGAAARLGGRLLALDQLGRLAGSAPVLAPRVEQRLRADLEAEVDAFVDWLESRRSRDAVAILRREADAVRRRHLERLRRRGHLTTEQLGAVEAASAAMIGELLHGPTLELRRGGSDAETVRRLFGLDA